MQREALKKIVLDQAAELAANLPRERGLSPQLRDLLQNSKQIKVVLGIRRSGKSTLCHLALKGVKEFSYVNFDDERLLSLTSANLQMLLEVLLELKPNCQIFFFDEIQNIENWELFINRLQRSNYNILVTGSNGKLLSQDLATHLTGRQISLTLHTLSFSEFLKWREPQLFAKSKNLYTSSEQASIRSEFSKYLSLGGFPAVVLGEPQRLYLQELFDKIINRDLVQRYKIRHPRILKEMALQLIQNSAQFISFENLRQTFNLKSINTAQKYVGYLESVFLIYHLRGYSYKLKERSTSARKIYACDLGMMAALWSKATSDHGAQIETLVFLDLISKGHEIYYLREQNREVDFVLLENGKPKSLIQVCLDLSSQKTKEREVRALLELGVKYNITDLRIITSGETSAIDAEHGNFKGKILIQDIAEFLLE